MENWKAREFRRKIEYKVIRIYVYTSMRVSSVCSYRVCYENHTIQTRISYQSVKKTNCFYHLNDIKKRLHIRNYSLDPIKSFLVVSLESSYPRFRFTLRETQRKDRSLVNLVTSSFSSFFAVKIPTNRKLGTATSR